MTEIIERRGKVVGIAHGVAHVRLDRDAGCGGCGSRSTCASGSAPEKMMNMALPEYSKLGDVVTVSMPSSSVAFAALLGYLLPPVCLLLGAIVAASICESDFAGVVGAGIGFVTGLLLTRMLSHLGFARRLSSTVCHSDFQSDSLPGEHP